MADHHHWHPTWYKPEHATGWDAIKEAVRRDWQQTKHDLHLAGGHELNQKGSDTLKQAIGKESIPSINDANPPKILGELDREWARIEPSLEYGYAARRSFGEKHAQWNAELENNLRAEWESAGQTSRDRDAWDDVLPYVRHGYDYKR
jgi:hypothetical protein